MAFGVHGELYATVFGQGDVMVLGREGRRAHPEGWPVADQRCHWAAN